MATCVVNDCPGHNGWVAVLVHAAGQILFDLHAIHQRLDRIEHDEEHIMADVDQVAADFETFRTDVSTAVTELKAELAAQGGIPQAVQDKLDAIDASITAADQALTTPPSPDSGAAPSPRA